MWSVRLRDLLFIARIRFRDCLPSFRAKSEATFLNVFSLLKEKSGLFSASGLLWYVSHPLYALKHLIWYRKLLSVCLCACSSITLEGKDPRILRFQHTRLSLTFAPNGKTTNFMFSETLRNSLSGYVFFICTHVTVEWVKNGEYTLMSLSPQLDWGNLLSFVGCVNSTTTLRVKQLSVVEPSIGSKHAHTGAVGSDAQGHFSCKCWVRRTPSVFSCRFRGSNWRLIDTKPASLPLRHS